jgi:hypothetical protein
VIGAATLLAVVSIAGVPQSEFRYTRQLPPQVASGTVGFEPDGAMLAHTRPGFADLRIVDASGARVGWRDAPESGLKVGRDATVLNRGDLGEASVALLDVGLPRRTYERVTLRISGGNFVGRVTASGADRRDGPYTQLSTTTVYDIAGASSARSTTIVLPPTDSRYLQLRATGVEAITGATVLGEAERPELVSRPHKVVGGVRNRGRRTALTLDLGHRGVPVSQLELEADTPARYDRPVTVEGSNDRRVFVPITQSTVRRAPGTLSPTIELGQSEYRYLRLTVSNGDDPPLGTITTQTFGASEALILEGGFKPPLTMYYGAALQAPDYEFARLPAAAPTSVLPPSALPPEQPNAAFAAPARTFGERNGWIVQAAIGLAALMVAGAGALVLRKKA